MVATVYKVGSAVPTSGSPSATATCTPGDVLVLMELTNYVDTAYKFDAVEGLGATWSRIPGADATTSIGWIGLNPTQASGTITTTNSETLPAGYRRTFIAYGVSGSTSTAAAYASTASGGTAQISSKPVEPGQAAFAFGFSDTSDGSLTVTPSAAWDTVTRYQIVTGRYYGYTNFGAQTSETVTASSYRSAGLTTLLMLVIGDPDGSTPPPPSLKVSVWEGGQRVSLNATSLLTAGGQATLSLSGIYETRAAVNYFDPAPVLSSIDAATTIAELETALAPLMTHSVATVDILETTATQGIYTAHPVAFTEPRLKPFLRYMVESLARIPEGKITGGDTIDIIVCDTITSSSGAAAGVAFQSTLDTFVSVQQGPTHFDTVGAEDEKAHPGLFMHELAHLIEYGSKDDYLNAFNTMNTDLSAANPPGFTYGGAAASEPFPGEHPVGFPRFYGRTSRVEDFADMVAFMTVPALYTDLRRWMQSDPYLAKKHAVVRRFLVDIGWGAYPIANMHGHLPLVHQL